MFSATSAIQIMLKDFLLLNRDEKVRAYFTELFLCKNFNYQSLFNSKYINDFEAKATSNSFKLKFESEYQGYKIEINYSNKKTVLYRIFHKTIFAPFFLNQNISISKNGHIVYLNGKKTQYYNSVGKTDMNNLAYFFTKELLDNSENHSNKVFSTQA